MGKSVLEAADEVFSRRIQAILDVIGSEVTAAYLDRLTCIVRDARERTLKLVAELECADLSHVMLFDKVNMACRHGVEQVQAYVYLIDDNGLLPLERKSDVAVVNDLKADKFGFHDLEEGMWVCYMPDYGGAEIGRVKGWNEKHVFVVYQCDGNWDRYEDYTGCATNMRDLKKVNRFKYKVR